MIRLSRILNVLVVCECSGEVRRSFGDLGHNAWSCDLKPAEDGSAFHIRGDAVETMTRGHEIKYVGAEPWDLFIMHPPCTYLSLSGIHWNKRRPDRSAKTAAAVSFVLQLMAATDGKPYCIENPASIISTHIRKKNQTIQPYQFGHDASKQTWLWLSGLPRLEAIPEKQWVPPRLVCQTCGKTYKLSRMPAHRKQFCLCGGSMLPRWANQTDSGQNRLGPSEQRATNRARTYPGIAKAMAAQWSKHLLSHE